MCRAISAAFGITFETGRSFLQTSCFANAASLLAPASSSFSYSLPASPGQGFVFFFNFRSLSRSGFRFRRVSGCPRCSLFHRRLSMPLVLVGLFFVLSEFRLRRWIPTSHVLIFACSQRLCYVIGFSWAVFRPSTTLSFPFRCLAA